jgi:large subunit ribosomal protein L5
MDKDKPIEQKEKYIPRLLKLYRESVVPALKSKLGYSSDFAVPRLIKIVINMGVGAATADAKIAEKAAEELATISGQKAKICRSRKPISNFKLKQNVPIGCCVTLRKARMYEFLDRFITAAVPRIRDFRGFSAHSFDGRGNYTFGLTEQSIFPEINLDKMSKTQGMNISIHTSAKNDSQAKELLGALGFPFRGK